jgi:hypothetical protein
MVERYGRNIQTVDIFQDVIEKLKGIKPADVDMKHFINNVLMGYAESQVLMKAYNPGITKIGVTGASMYLKDEKMDAVAEIVLKDSGKVKELWCKLDKATDCQHVHYAISQPDIGKLVSAASQTATTSGKSK